jgi:hypothetical protein
MEVALDPVWWEAFAVQYDQAAFAPRRWRRGRRGSLLVQFRHTRRQCVQDAQECRVGRRVSDGKTRDAVALRQEVAKSQLIRQLATISG